MKIGHLGNFFQLCGLLSVFIKFSMLCCDKWLWISLELTSSPEKADSVLDLAAEELRTAIVNIGRITGKVGIEEILDVVFKDFCIGKWLKNGTYKQCFF